VRLTPFSRLARVSGFWLSEPGVLSAKRDKLLVGKADDALSVCWHGRFPSRLLLLVK